MAPAPSRRFSGLALAWFLALTAGLYGRTLFFGYTGSDDVVLIRDQGASLHTAKSLLDAFTGPLFRTGVVYYRPLVGLSYFLDAQWRAEDLRAFHATNLALHAAATFLLFRFLGTLRLGAWPALLLATVFAVHPANTETVAWVPGRTDSLLAVCVLGALLTLRKWVERLDARALVAHAVLTLLALLSKESAIILPLLYAADLALLQDRRDLLRDRRLWAAWAAPVVGYLALRGAADLPDASAPIEYRIQVFFEHLHVVLMHLGKIVFPYKLSVLAYAGDTPWIPGALALIAAALVARRLRGAAARLAAWGAACFLLFVLPALPVSEFLILENRLYLPAMGVLVLLLGLALPALASPRSRRIAAGVAGAVAVVFAVISSRYASAFRDQDAFTAAAARQSPGSAFVQMSRGTYFQGERRFDEAARAYDDALRLDDRQPVLHNNLGILHLAQGDAGGAERELRREIELNPRFDNAHYNLGLALDLQGRNEEARAAFRRAVALNPANTEARRLAEAETSAKTVDTASVPSEMLVKIYEDALAKAPHDTAARRQYARLCAARGLPCARRQYEMLLQDVPGDEEARRGVEGR